MNEPAATSLRVVVVGGGASGVIFAVNLARADRDIEIIVVERRADLGRGLAYSTKDPNHLLNVRVANMSAFPDDADHFYRWLQDHGAAHNVGAPTHFCFAPRRVYGEYLASLLAEETPQGVRVIRASCDDIVELPDQVRVKLSTGITLTADAVVIATGHDPKADLPGSATVNPWAPGALSGLAPDAPVMIVGTGLTMADVALSLHHSGHHGKIIAVSRRGLQSAVHADIRARPIAGTDIPFGAPLSNLTRWLRKLVRERAKDGLEWRSAIDALRPYTRRLWQSMTIDQRRRFLRHARPWWEVHRHRMAPTVAMTMHNLMAEGRLEVVAGSILTIEGAAGHAAVTIRRRGSADSERHEFARVFNCSGVSDDLQQSQNPVVRALFARNLARPDALFLGLDLSDGNALLDSSGRPSRRIFALGPVARGAFWEITAVPDIRQQCFELANQMVRELTKPEKAKLRG